ncbi:MAG: hypothetical protein IJU45_07355, partial [Clostridia bacterium]|nr:hypothetical protein [Clostridia bacterium]
EIFLNRRKALEYFEGNNYPAKINLDYNFRSRKGVTDFVNFVFSQLMSEDIGGLCYDEAETLKPKAEYPETDQPETEVHFVCMANGASPERDDEAQHIADYIKQAIKDKMLIKDGDSQRPVSYRDFCILLRAAANRADIYADVLNKNSIPCYIASRTGFFDTAEIKTALSLMQVVDNPMLDIPLTSVLLSPIYGFSPDELALLRCECPEEKCSYYTCVKYAADNGKKKCIDFIESVARLRALSVTLGAGEFVREMLLDTGYEAMVSAMLDGDSRRANLALLLEYAEKYEQAGHTGISGFLRFIDNVRSRNGDFEIANSISESADTVKIMTVHKSKGLEFPVCIIADCSAKFKSDISTFAFDPKYGVAFKRKKASTALKRLLSEPLKRLTKWLKKAKKCACFTLRSQGLKKSSSALSGIKTPKRNFPNSCARLKETAKSTLTKCLNH